MGPGHILGQANTAFVFCMSKVDRIMQVYFRLRSCTPPAYLTRSILRNPIYPLILQSVLGKQLRKFRHASSDRYPEASPGEALNSCARVGILLH